MWSLCNFIQNAMSKTWIEISPVSSSLMLGSRAKPTFLNDCHLLCCCIPQGCCDHWQVGANQTDTWLPLNDRTIAHCLSVFLFVWIWMRPVTVQTWIHEYIKVACLMSLCQSFRPAEYPDISIVPFELYKKIFTRTISACIGTSVAAYLPISLTELCKSCCGENKPLKSVSK